MTEESFDDRSLIRFQTPQTKEVIEKNVSSVLAINPGGDGRAPFNSFVPNDPLAGKGVSDRGKDRLHDYDPKPRFLWGIGSSPNGSGSSSGGSSSALSANAIPEESEWDSDQYVWDKVQENDSSTSEEEENIKQPGKLEVNVDFQYEYDSNGNPTLLVPNPGKARTKRNYHRVEFDQTASHMHHAPDLNIPLPSDFDMVHYKNLNRADKIDYAKQKLPRETIINYQNEIGKSISPLFGPKETFLVPGFAGKFKQNTELTIQQTDTPDKTILSIIREDGVHISSFSVTNEVLREITKDNFWVLKNRNL